MKRLIGLPLLMSVALAVNATDRITASITITNAPTVNGDTLVVNSDTRAWTNNVVNAGSEVLTNAAIGGCTTNLWLHVVAAPFAGPVSAAYIATNQINLVGAIGQTMTVSQTGDWCEIAYTTQTVSTLQTVRVPMASETEAARTNIATLLVTSINAYSQTNFDATTSPFTNVVNTTTDQTVYGTKTWTGTNYFIGASLGATNLTVTNISSPGTGVNSEQYGDEAAATGDTSTAIGYQAKAGQTYALAVGATSSATNIASVAIGGVSIGEYSIAIGVASLADGNQSIAIGDLANTGTYTNAITIGYASANTAHNQIMLGSALHTVQAAGIISGPTITNATYYGTIGLLTGGYIDTVGATNLTVTNTTSKGTFDFTGDLALQRANHTALANGNNAAVDFGTGSFAKIKAGPTAAFAICGIAGGRNGRVLVVYNSVAQDMTFANESGVEPVATNRVVTLTGGDVTTTGIGSGILIYDTDATRWVLISSSP